MKVPEKDPTTNSIYKCSAKAAKKHNAQSVVEKHYESFYADANKFTDTKRFERFMLLFESKATELVKNLDILLINTDDELIKKSSDCTFANSINRAVKAYMFTEYIGKERNVYEGWLSVCDLYANAMLRPFSALKEVIRLLKEADSFDEETLMKCIGSSFNSEVFSVSYYQSLCCACYNYINSLAVEKDLTDINWFTAVKDLNDQQTFHIMIKVFEHLVTIIEDASALRMVHNYHLNDDTTSKLLLRIVTMKQELEERENDMKQKQETISVRDREIAELKQRIAVLQDQLDINTSDTQERAALRKKLKEEKAKNEELQQKLASMQEYIDLLSAKKDPEPVSEITEEDITLFADKHIVFVRDKQNEGYILMKRLAERFPNAKFTNVIASDIDIKATDLVVQLVQYQSHSTYWKASGIAKRNSIPILVSTHANFSAITKQICDVFSGKER